MERGVLYARWSFGEWQRRVTWIVRDFRCTRDATSAAINRVFLFGARRTSRLASITNSWGLDCPYSGSSRWIRLSTIQRDGGSSSKNLRPTVPPPPPADREAFQYYTGRGKWRLSTDFPRWIQLKWDFFSREKARRVYVQGCFALLAGGGRSVENLT